MDMRVAVLHSRHRRWPGPAANHGHRLICVQILYDDDGIAVDGTALILGAWHKTLHERHRQSESDLLESWMQHRLGGHQIISRIEIPGYVGIPADYSAFSHNIQHSIIILLLALIDFVRFNCIVREWLSLRPRG